MKKNKLRFSILGVTCCILLAAVSFASSNRDVTVSYGGIKIYLNGIEQTAKDVNGKVVEPLVYEGTTYVPVRAVSQWYGKTVTWQNSTNSIFINDAVFSESDISAAKSAINKFFGLFDEKKYQGMQEMCTGDAAEMDYSKGVFGMKEAKLTSCNYNGDYSARDNKLIFECSFEMKPADSSVYDENQTKCSCLIYVEKSGDQFLISEFASGF